MGIRIWEKGVMVGAGAKILGPIHVGRNSVIGANAVVLRDVPPDSIAAGVPARVIGKRAAAEAKAERETQIIPNV